MEIDYFMGTCVDPQIGKIAERRGRKFSYKKACALIKEEYPELYNDLSLDLRNPWADQTQIIDKDILHIVHSASDYLFKLRNYQ